MDSEFVRDLFSEFGVVKIKRMFGGSGIYAGGVMFAIMSDGIIYLKADAETVPAFERENCTPFQYATRNGKRVVMSYWRLPERLYDEPGELARWAEAAVGVARSMAAGKNARRRRLRS